LYQGTPLGVPQIAPPTAHQGAFEILDLKGAAPKGAFVSESCGIAEAMP
jgi:hypothetical protein